MSISKIWWFVSNFSEIFLEISVSSILSLNLTETDSISVEGNSFLNNAKTNVESIPELKDIPILPVFVPISWEIFALIDFSTNSELLSSLVFSWKSLARSLGDRGCKCVE